MMHHLGSWVSSLADGQLGPADAERALAHVAACPPCARQLAVARQARQALSVVADAEPAPDLTARLLALAADPLARSEPARRYPVLPLGSSAYSKPARALTGDLNPRRRPGVRVAAGAMAGVTVAVASVFVLGAQPAVVPSGRPADALSMLGAAGGAGSTPTGKWDPVLATQISATASSASTGTADATVLGWMRDAGWTCPLGLPAGYEVTAARLIGAGGSVLELDLAGPQGRVVLTEEVGRLDASALAGARAVATGDRTVYVLTRAPWHVVWQAGETVVSVVAEAPSDSAAALIAAFPAAEYDGGAAARISRGWNMVTGAVARP